MSLDVACEQLTRGWREDSTKMVKQLAVSLLRETRLLPLAELARFLGVMMCSSAENRKFARRSEGFVPPPGWIMYDAFGDVDYCAYHNSGKGAARAIANTALPHLGSKRQARILEWGCGPARIVQHIPRDFEALTPTVYATDYNRRTIRWCKDAIPNINFDVNELNPPLPFETAAFDFVYCVSVFTHLSENSHYEWLKELRRVLAPGGVAMITMHGDKFRANLLPLERAAYDQGQIVVRGAVKEGSRIYSSFHSPAFMRQFLGESNIVLHDPNPDPAISGGQDVWLTR